MGLQAASCVALYDRKGLGNVRGVELHRVGGDSGVQAERGTSRCGSQGGKSAG